MSTTFTKLYIRLPFTEVSQVCFQQISTQSRSANFFNRGDHRNSVPGLTACPPPPPLPPRLPALSCAVFIYFHFAHPFSFMSELCKTNVTPQACNPTHRHTLLLWFFFLKNNYWTVIQSFEIRDTLQEIRDMFFFPFSFFLFYLFIYLFIHFFFFQYSPDWCLVILSQIKEHQRRAIPRGKKYFYQSQSS